MSQPIIPESAPFNAEQRQWLNGFISGLLAQQNQQADAPAGPPLHIFFGSQTGNSEALARGLRKEAQKRGFAPTMADLDSCDSASFAELERVLIITSTFGEGEPPDNARKFGAWLEAGDCGDLSKVNYTVCALGDSNYPDFCAFGTLVDEQLAKLGAQRMVEVQICDVGYDAPFDQWQARVWEHEAMHVDAAAVPTITAGDAEDDDEPKWTKKNPFPATLLASRPLNGEGSSKDTRHVELSLAGSDLSYEPGDVLGMWPVNDPTSTQEIIDAINATGYEQVTDPQGTISGLREVLMRGCDINTITDALFDLVATHTTTDDLADIRHDATKRQEWAVGRQVIDVVQTWPGSIDPQSLIDSLRPLQPRLYSISSSLKAHPNQVHLTVGAVRYQTHGRARQGVASTFFADRAGIGNTVGIYLQHSPHFKLPADSSTPLIMIGPGTGIAPFRSFLGERAAQVAAGDSVGPAWLFFGDQHAHCDYLYEDELKAFQEQGILSRIDTAFSRDQDKKVYVQHRIIEASADIWDYLEQGGHIYICGDASRMAKDVHQALCSVVAEHHTGGDMGAADAFMTELANTHRYCRDVY